ncbi:branched-chain amino acid ABC transporter substrate-binding protein [Methylobacterium gossipiicola]|uniref:Amino acid/amide ABC transporter substrate-binding protein, HAAT family n=1 Tax=Methylobacterium gossipiicola TaxID=582675 RepID=A0A1I2RJK0_9HYPH|nr:branched-chain amino acid ABC transporter substrate-binding protein [Methylobacterium gossipiicola]SFG37946.1 amino acid/amide ABC transporter substrate-binding protein, HAAT family [Methylobacterium gossipiicola]
MRRLALAFTLLAGAAQAEPAPIAIGLSAPLTGPDAAFGQGMRAGAEQAVADINRAGGVDGRRLALVVADDAGDPKQGLAVARRFATERVGLVVGPLNAAVASAAVPVYAEAGVVAVTPGVTWAPLTARGHWNVFRTCPNEAQQSAVAGAYLVSHFAGQRIGLVHDKTSFGRGLVDGVARALKASGQGEAAFEALARGDKDPSGLVARLKRARVEAVYFGGLAAEATVLLRAMREAGLTAPLVGSDGLLDRELSQNPAADGTVMTLAPTPRLPETKGAAAKPRAPETELFAAQSYAAVEVLRAGLVGARATEGRAVAAFLHGGQPVKTVLGPLAFEGNGDPKADSRRPTYALQVWRRTPDGRLDYAGNTVEP